MQDRDDGSESLVVKRLVTRQCEALQRAGALYQAARFAGQISRLLSWLAGCPDHLVEASQILPDGTSTYQDGGLQSVAIKRIIASERRCQDFDRAFHPLRDRDGADWTKLAALRLLGAELPPVELFQVGNVYIVRDGHVRISVASALGQESIEAWVTRLEYITSISNDCRGEADNGFHGGERFNGMGLGVAHKTFE